ncbi:MAG: Nop10-like protein SnoRNP [archaeon GW2011_AR5]|nr:MAG: Nop10-like protein SnoRNP [archaeon GW2011_AR5]
MLKKCPVHGYTTKGCCEHARSAHPPKFSSEDKYGKYRRLAKKK